MKSFLLIGVVLIVATLTFWLTGIVRWFLGLYESIRQNNYSLKRLEEIPSSVLLIAGSYMTLGMLLAWPSSSTPNEILEDLIYGTIFFLAGVGLLLRIRVAWKFCILESRVTAFISALFLIMIAVSLLAAPFLGREHMEGFLPPVGMFKFILAVLGIICLFLLLRKFSVFKLRTLRASQISQLYEKAATKKKWANLPLAL